LPGNIAGCAAVLAAVGAVSLGLPAIDAAIPSQRSISSTTPLVIGPGVSVLPPAHAMLDARGTAPSSNLVRLDADGLTYRIQVRDYGGPLDRFAAGLRDAIGHRAGPQAIGDETDVRTGDGVPGRAARFTNTDGTSGRYAAYLDNTVGVWVVVSGPDDSMLHHDGGIDRTLASLRFGGRS
jgi:hypothetical protein